MSLIRRACTCCRPLAAPQALSTGAAHFATSATSGTPPASTPGGTGSQSAQGPRPPRPPHTQRRNGVGKPQPGKAHQQRRPPPKFRSLLAPDEESRAAFSPGSGSAGYGQKPRGEQTRWGEGLRGNRTPAAGFEFARPGAERYDGDSTDQLPMPEFGARKPGGLYGGSREPRSGGFGQKGGPRQQGGREQEGGFWQNARRDRDQPREGRFGMDPSRNAPRRDMGQINDRSRLRQEAGESIGVTEIPEADLYEGAGEVSGKYEEAEVVSASRGRPSARASGPPSRSGESEKSSRSYRAIQAEGGRDGFVLSRGRDRPKEKEEKERGRGKDREAMNADRIRAERRQKEAKVVPDVKIEKKVFVPSSVSVGRLADIFGVKIFNLQRIMQRLGLTEDQRRSDYLLTSEEACNIALEYGLDPTVDDERTFDIFPEPDQEGVVQPLRPPVVTIMGHVDHGKTTLLDSLRHSSVATGEAGGITQHIGAFSVPLSSLLPSSTSSSETPGTITFLDTPGHAAFTAMRARGASVTDMIVLVVAADDGVMPQTREVIELWKADQDKVGLVVAINKCDKAGIDFDKIKSALGAEGILLEEDGGDVPSVRVSGLQGEGLDKLVETLSTLAEIRELRARREGKAEGYVLESRVDRGQGNVATVLVSKGTLTAGTCIVAGTTWARVRQMQDSAGRSIKSAPPGTPVSIMGWREIPHAGDQLLEAASEDEAKKAITNRLREIENRKLLSDVESINIKRVAERKKLEKEEEEVQRLKEEGKTEAEIQAWKREFERTDGREEEGGRKELRLVIKGDVSGSVEAVVGSLEGIGNKEAGVKIVHVGVGEVGESDIRMAEAAGASIIAFSVPTSKSNQTLARTLSVPHHADSVIYRLIETVRSEVIKLLPKVYESRVTGEATCQAIFEIKMKGKEVVRIAGCKVSNGAIEVKEGVGIRVLRGAERTQVYEGTIETLKHLKKDVTEVHKGTECGISFHGFTDVKEGDEIIAFTKFEVPRHL